MTAREDYVVDVIAAQPGAPPREKVRADIRALISEGFLYWDPDGLRVRRPHQVKAWRAANGLPPLP